MQKKHLLIGALIIGVGLALTVLIPQVVHNDRSELDLEEKFRTEVAEKKVESQKENQAKPNQSVTKEPAKNQLPALNEVTLQKPRGQTKPVDAVSIQKNQRYAEIKKKIILSDAETVERNKLINDKELISSIGAALRSESEIGKIEIDSAIDLLIESFEKGEREMAWQEIVTIVNDNKIDDSTIALPVREELAGIKGEIMFHISALAPQAADYFDSLKLSVATQVIWQNVKQKQQENYQISLEEKVAHEN